MHIVLLTQKATVVGTVCPSVGTDITDWSLLQQTPFSLSPQCSTAAGSTFITGSIWWDLHSWLGTQYCVWSNLVDFDFRKGLYVTTVLKLVFAYTLIAEFDFPRWHCMVNIKTCICLYFNSKVWYPDVILCHWQDIKNPVSNSVSRIKTRSLSTFLWNVGDIVLSFGVLQFLTRKSQKP